MGRRFNFDDDDFQDENIFPDTESEQEFNKRQEVFNLMQLDIVKSELNQRLLNRVIKMCENHDDWHKKCHKSRLKMIIECYSVLSGLMSEGEGD
jgi:hypothetical protein